MLDLVLVGVLSCFLLFFFVMVGSRQFEICTIRLETKKAPNNQTKPENKTKQKHKMKRKKVIPQYKRHFNVIKLHFKNLSFWECKGLTRHMENLYFSPI